MFAVPELRQVGDLGNRHNGAFRDSVAAGPGIHLSLAHERQDGRAVMMHVAPSAMQRHRKMGDDVVVMYKTATDINVEILRFAADPGVNDDKYADAERAPAALRLPTQFPSLHLRVSFTSRTGLR